MELLFWVTLLLIFQTFIGFPLSLKLIEKIKSKKLIKKDSNYKPKLSFIIAAHNEEKVIKKKLENTLALKYPRDLMEIIVASDNSSDSTNYIVKKFISDNTERDLKLYEVKERKGKTNAQNEAVRLSNGEIIIFSDANSIWETNAILKLVENFSDKNIGYVCGKLEYVNSFDNLTSNAESTYWNYDLAMRKIESDLASVTAGNGAIYAIRKTEYIEIDPIECHDGSYPTLMVLRDKRAIFDDKAIAYEKAGETSEDEFSRKVRMGRTILKLQYSNFSKYNLFKTGSYSYFYFCHRYLRYSLYLMHVILLVLNILLLTEGILYQIMMIGQILFYILALIGNFMKIKNKVFYFPMYYTMTILAQLVAVKRTLLGQNKPFWEKAESTR